MLESLSPQVIGMGLALAVGFLVGLEREWASHKPIGLRSFTLIGAAGGLASLLSQTWGGWLVGAVLAAISALIITHTLRRRASGDDDEADHGITTVLAAVAVYLIGAACVAGYQVEAVVLGGIVTVLLHWKQPLHGLVERLGVTEFSAIIRFVLISLVVLPILPNDTFGPYEVFNPFQTWLLVVLIVALNLIGYVVFRLFGADAGAVLGGIVGGLISSTATSVSFSRMTRGNTRLSASAALIILLASAVLYGRVAVELVAVAPGLLRHAGPPMGAFALLMVAASAVMLPRVWQRKVELPDHENPARLKVALTFAALYAVIIFSVAAARDYLGERAIYGVAMISGLANVDAMTLSTAQLFHRDEVSADMAWRAIFLATLANLLFKVGAACVLGAPALRVYMLTLGGGALAAGAAVLVLWP